MGLPSGLKPSQAAKTCGFKSLKEMAHYAGCSYQYLSLIYDEDLSKFMAKAEAAWKAKVLDQLSYSYD